MQNKSKEDIVSKTYEETETATSTNTKVESALMRKNFVWNFVGTMAYAFTSLFFMIIVTRINGIEEAGIFTFAFSFATMMQVFALYQGRTYQVTERSSKITDSDFILFKIFSCFTMIIAGLIFCLFRDYTFDKNLIIFVMLSYKCLDGFAEAIYGVFQKYNKLYQCGISLLLKSVLTVLVFFCVDYFTGNLLLGTISILFADILVFIFYDLLHFKKYDIEIHKLKFSIFKTLIVGGFAVFIFTFMSQYLANAQKYVIDFMATHSQQTIFGVIIMPATFVSLCAQLIINPFLYQINEFLKEKAYIKYKKLVLKICLYVAGLGLLVIVVSYFIGIPILNIIYGLDLNEYLWALIIVLFGSTLFGIVAVISNALIAIRKNVSQIVFYLVSSVVATVLAVALIPAYGIYGAAVSFCVAYLILLTLFFGSFLFECRRLIRQ